MAVTPLPIPSCVYFLLFRMLFIVQPIRKAQVPSFLTEHGESFSVCCTDLHFQDFFVKSTDRSKSFTAKLIEPDLVLFPPFYKNQMQKEVFYFPLLPNSPSPRWDSIARISSGLSSTTSVRGTGSSTAWQIALETG